MLDLVQGSPEWLAARCGKATASRIGDIIAKTKSGPSASRANYLAELVAERLTGEPAEKFTNSAMQWGTEKEPTARAAYEFYRNSTVSLVGFVPHPTIAEAGASPDGLIGDLGLIEIKCPNTATHIEYLEGQTAPKKYLVQMQWQMACTGRRWCDFASFDPRMPDELQLFVTRVHRDDDMIADLEKEVGQFLDEVSAKVTALRRIADPAPVNDILFAG